jgi:hypothetical protein
MVSGIGGSRIVGHDIPKSVGLWLDVSGTKNHGPHSTVPLTLYSYCYNKYIRGTNVQP